LKSTNHFKNGVISLIAKEEIEKELVEDYIWEYCERIIREFSNSTVRELLLLPTY
jgi:hypothetical protein